MSADPVDVTALELRRPDGTPTALRDYLRGRPLVVQALRYYG